MRVCDRVVVATDAREIVDAVKQAGFEAVLTSPEHRSGTERVAEVVAKQDFREFNFVVNVQGDEPFIDPAAIRGALACLERGEILGTAAGSLDPQLAGDPNRVKVVVDARARAVYFSRAPIPFDRDGSGEVVYHQHVGVYAYTPEALNVWVQLPPVPEERWERLEQLRPLLHGIPMGITLFDAAPAPGIDTPADLAWAEAHAARHLREVSP
jgi:3-deoxy-manno-octulosonate cytidylyltransferase (CMP-KDO synthetase)